ncbi:MAG TPA: choice-of-anchor Q domain-containing protein [Myxococcaceae bacterium]|nr:choice-of-anchor Q domain-containing protein [Myxococcaceae bacterium]
MLAFLASLAAWLGLGGHTFTVDTTLDAVDANPGDGICARAVVGNSDGFTTPLGRCTLRAAVMEAEATWRLDTIVVPSGSYHLDLAPSSGGGRLSVTRSVRIQGAGADSTVIDQDRHDIIIYVTGGDIEIDNVTLQGGESQSGGGLRIEGPAELSLTDSIVRASSAFTGGGGLLINTGATATLRRVSVLDNVANGAFGGGLWNKGETWVYDSTFANNVSNRAGAIRNEGNLNLRNVTISGNQANSPEAGTGGISQNGFAVLNNVTITGNTGVGNNPASFRGGGIQTTAGQLTVVKNSIIAGNTGGAGPNDCDGALTPDSKYNLIGDSDGCSVTSYVFTYALDVSPGLGSLGSHGGPTLTQVPGFTSPALDAAYGFPPPAADACEPRDQRGVPRPQGTGHCDLGAVEVTPSNAFVTGFVLVNADTNTDVRPLLHGDTLDLTALPAHLSVRAVVSGFAGSVVFGLDGTPSFQVENVSPWALGGDAPLGDYLPVAFTTGQHALVATPFAGSSGSGAAGGSRSITFRVAGLPFIAPHFP